MIEKKSPGLSGKTCVLVDLLNKFLNNNCFLKTCRAEFSFTRKLYVLYVYVDAQQHEHGCDRALEKSDLRVKVDEADNTPVCHTQFGFLHVLYEHP